MAQVDVNKIIINDYSTDEVLKTIVSLHATGKAQLMKSITEQNLGWAGAAMQSYAQAESLAKALSEKLNGKKQATVV